MSKRFWSHFIQSNHSSTHPHNHSTHTHTHTHTHVANRIGCQFTLFLISLVQIFSTLVFWNAQLFVCAFAVCDLFCQHSSCPHHFKQVQCILSFISFLFCMSNMHFLMIKTQSSYYFLLHLSIYRLDTHTHTLLHILVETHIRTHKQMFSISQTFCFLFDPFTSIRYFRPPSNQDDDILLANTTPYRHVVLTFQNSLIYILKSWTKWFSITNYRQHYNEYYEWLIICILINYIYIIYLNICALTD